MTTPTELTPGHLRTTPAAGWVLEDEDAQLAALDAVEALALVVLDVILRRVAEFHPLDQALALRAVGTIATREGLTRLAHYRGVDEASRPREASDELHAAAAADVWAVLTWLVDLPPDGPPRLRGPSPAGALQVLALDELHAAAVGLDHLSSRRGAKLTRSTRTMTRRRNRRT